MSASERDFEVRQAPDQLHRARITGVTVAGIFVTVISLVVAWYLLALWSRGPELPAAAPTAAPRTISTVEQSLIRETNRGGALRAEQRAALDRWGWVDRQSGLAKLPIDTAIDVFVAHPPPVDGAIAPLAPTTTSGVPSPPPQGKDVAP